jgi:dTDP-4-dehydrorhamnose reductase
MNGHGATVLVTGADGQIGGELVRGLRRHGLSAVGTTRRREHVRPDRIYLDLADDPARWELPDGVEAAVLAAAVARFDACERDPEGTERVNVAANLALAEALLRRGAYVVFLSSNQVFDGTEARRLASDPPAPRTVYGGQKAVVERHLLANRGAAAVLRLTKVVTPGLPLFNGWAEALRTGSPIQPFRDMVLAPISVALVTGAVARMIERRSPGIVQASGPRDIPYSEVGCYIARTVGAEAELVQPRSFADAGLPTSFAPRHTTLDTTRLREELGLVPADVWTAIDEALAPPSPEE